jgi:hypothetical protein
MTMIGLAVAGSRCKGALVAPGLRRVLRSAAFCIPARCMFP